MTRTTGVPAGRCFSYSDVGSPAHSETTSVPGVIASASAASSGSMSCGLTATISTSADAAASAVSTPRTP